MIKRASDIIISIVLISLLLPFIILLYILVVLTSKGGGIYRQTRVGRHNKDFKILKYRTMVANAEEKGMLTIGSKDPRITSMGFILRKFKLDELPQLFNVLAGNMSMVGPRPEVRKYVNLYTNEQLKVLEVRPGITDYASINFSNESDILKNFDDPEKVYLQEIMPQKLDMNLQYIENQNLLSDLKIIFLTLLRIIRL